MEKHYKYIYHYDYIEFLCCKCRTDILLHIAKNVFLRCDQRIACICSRCIILGHAYVAFQV